MPYQRVDRATLRARLQDRFDAAPFWTDTDANLALNHALRLWNALTGYWRRRISISGPINDPLIPIPSGSLVQRTAVTCQGQAMTPTTLHSLGLLRPNWWTERTTSGGSVPTRPLLWAPVGLTLFVVWPAPVVQMSFGVDGVRTTPILTTDGSFIDIGDEELSVLIGYCLHVLAIKAGPVVVQRTAEYHRTFIRAAALRNSRLLASNWYRNFERQSLQKAIVPPAIPPAETLAS